ncbi:Uncharacterised protein [uncultured archaeon]|nr:Uncharacterised protein [uncultured archaeon]
MQASISILILFCLMATAIAENDSTVMGPYQISFDLSVSKESYIISPREETSHYDQGPIKYKLKIKIKNDTDSTHLMTLSLSKGGIDASLTPKSMRMGMRESFLKAGLININTSEGVIDGKWGAICTGVAQLKELKFLKPILIETYQVSYHPFNDTTAIITSTYPWNEGTMQFLKTLHIERINATAS